MLRNSTQMSWIKLCKSFRDMKEMQDDIVIILYFTKKQKPKTLISEYSRATIGVDTAENEPLKKKKRISSKGADGDSNAVIVFVPLSCCTAAEAWWA